MHEISHEYPAGDHWTDAFRATIALRGPAPKRPAGGTFFGETWEYYLSDPATFTTFGNGCPGSAGMPRMGAAFANLPWVGEPFQAELSTLPTGPFNLAFLLFGFDNTSYAGNALPVDMGPLGAPGCDLLVGPTQTIGLANQGGWAAWVFMVPNDTGLIGTHFFLQGWVLDIGINQLNSVFSDGGDGRIGAR